jgi:UDP-N-acetylmuramyl tripeptide synthase
VAVRAAGSLARGLGAGAGTVIGGRVGLGLDPGLLERLGSKRRTAVVSGTNGKTTTTRLLAAAIQASSDPDDPVVTNAAGSNMPAGLVAALAAGRPGAPAVLEVDEGYLPRALSALAPQAALLLNLSRDQLDRTSEVRMLSNRWRDALGGAPGTTAVANADDPLVVWGAGTAHRVVWVAAGLNWTSDAAGCPACSGRITFASAPGGGWSCQCGFSRPDPDVTVSHDAAGRTWSVGRDGRRLSVELALPGRFNASNAVMAASAAGVLGVDPAAALQAMAAVGSVGGRFSVRDIAGVRTRLLLAKNPSGWRELLDLVAGERRPVVVAINSRVADGCDPSWLWDVELERLRGRVVVAAGERAHDLAVRLRYAEVEHRTCTDTVRAVAEAAASSKVSEDEDVAVDLIANYTAFFDLAGRR